MWNPENSDFFRVDGKRKALKTNKVKETARNEFWDKYYESDLFFFEIIFFNNFRNKKCDKKFRFISNWWKRKRKNLKNKLTKRNVKKRKETPRNEFRDKYYERGLIFFEITFFHIFSNKKCDECKIALDLAVLYEKDGETKAL